MGKNSSQKDDTRIFSEGKNTFDALLNLLYAYLGYNTYVSPYGKILFLKLIHKLVMLNGITC